MDSILSAVSSVFTSAIGWVGTVADTVTQEPILLVFAIVPLIGLGIGVFKRLLSVN